MSYVKYLILILFSAQVYAQDFYEIQNSEFIKVEKISKHKPTVFWLGPTYYICQRVYGGKYIINKGIFPSYKKAKKEVKRLIFEEKKRNLEEK